VVLSLEKNTKVLAIDLGSNTIRFVVYDCQKDTFLWAFEKIVKTADNLHQSKIVSKEAMRRVVCAILEAKTLYDFTNHKVVAYTTQAIRVALNSSDVLQYISEQTGVKFTIIDGELEAKLTLKAIEYRVKKLNISNDEFALIDIGGGSTEITFKYKDRVISKSFPIGIVTIAQRYTTLDEISKNLDKEFLSLKEFIKSIYEKNPKVNSLIATAGTPTTLASMKHKMSYKSYDSSKINGTLIYLDELQLYLNRLLNMSQEQRVEAVGVGRDDLIIAGILIYQKIFKLLDLNSSIIIDDGLREGIALSEC
jgi:exopolyphosphatase/guanosine-5'-triphosphate,3'-diphosphate pyrophosphatase